MIESAVYALWGLVTMLGLIVGFLGIAVYVGVKLQRKLEKAVECVEEIDLRIKKALDTALRYLIVASIIGALYLVSEWVQTQNRRD